jgi:hypothetical protein
MSLEFGLSAAVPEGASAAWGCRAIVTQDGHVDIPPDRMCAMGDLEFLDVLSKRFPMKELRAHLTDALRSRQMLTREAKDIVLFTDEMVTVVANSNASAGYVYVAAFPTP